MKWEDEEVVLLKKLYSETSTKELEKIFKRSIRAISSKAKKLGLKRKSKYYIDIDYFKKIDTEEKAYWLGFIWADGYICKRNRNENITYETNIRLCQEDKYHLEKLRDCLNSNYEIKQCKFKNNFCSKDKYYSKLYISKSLFGDYLYNELGIVPNRHDCKKIIKHIPYDLFKHFIRGLVDGDGSFSKYTTVDKNYKIDKYIVSIGGSEELLKICEKYLYDNHIIESTGRKLCRRHKESDGYFRTLVFSGRNQTLNILNYLYKDSLIYLDRKYEKYKNIL